MVSQKTSTTIKDDIFDLEFDCLIGTDYHNARRSFLNNVHRFTMFIVIIMGTSAAVTLGIDQSIWFSLATVFFAAFELVYNPSSKTRDHDFLYQRFTLLLGEIKSNPQTTKNVNIWQKEMHQIWASEPPMYETLQMIAHNKVCAMHHKESDMKKVKWWQRVSKNLLSFSIFGAN